MANLIEFYSTLDGYDQVPVSRNRSVFRQLVDEGKFTPDTLTTLP